jgi:hypothetical protein
MNCECWLTPGRHDCLCFRINWRGFGTASACCVEDGCVLSYQRGWGLHCECVLCGGREESVCCHIDWLGLEVSVCSDRLGVLGVLRRVLCGGREESVCCHIDWLGLEVSVCSDRLGVLGVLRRLLFSIH